MPIFSSRWSKYGVHVRWLRVPWANLVFYERVIIAAIRRPARYDPMLFDIYPDFAELRSSFVICADIVT